MDRRALWGEHRLSMQRRGYAPSSIVARRSIVSAWLKWLEVADVDVFDADAEHVELFLDKLGRAAGGRCTATSHLHMFYRWARTHGHTLDDPTERVERPRIPPGVPNPIHPTSLQLALTFSQVGPHADPRMEAALFLAAVSGLRSCELGRLRWEDISEGEARVLGKGSKVRIVPLGEEAIEALDRISRTSEYVLDGWQTPDDANPGRSTSRRISAHIRAAGATGTAHRLRHRAATEALDRCGNMREVQTLMGHASVATTALYTKVAAGRALRHILAPVNTPSEQGTARIRDYAQRPRSVIFRRNARS